MQIKELLIGIPIVVFIFWVFTAATPGGEDGRIQRACAPIQWVGNLTTSTTALSTQKHTETAATWADKLDYGCQYLIWRLFYQKAYNEAIEKGLIEPGVPDSDVQDDLQLAPGIPQKPIDPSEASTTQGDAGE